VRVRYQVVCDRGVVEVGHAGIGLRGREGSEVGWAR